MRLTLKRRTVAAPADRVPAPCVGLLQGPERLHIADTHMVGQWVHCKGCVDPVSLVRYAARQLHV